MCKEEIRPDRTTLDDASDPVDEVLPEAGDDVVEPPPKSAVEEPAAREDEATASRTDALAEEVRQDLQALRELFEQKIARNQNQWKMFDALHNEMKGYKERFLVDALQKPIVRQLIMLYDSVVFLESQFDGILDGQGPDPNAEMSQFRKNLENVRLELEEVLFCMDVTPYEERLERLDRRLHRTLARQATDDPDEDRKVARVHKIGFYWQGKVFRPEEVTIFRYQPVAKVPRAPRPFLRPPDKAR